MGQVKSLPVVARPGFETECYHNIRLSVLFASRGLTPWYYSHFVNLVLNQSVGESFPRVRFEEHLDLYGSVLDERPLKPEGSWVEAIRGQVDRGRYVVAYMNWKHIRISAYYGQRDMVHEALIYGYDEERAVFKLLAFDVDGQVYGACVLSYTDIEQGLERVVRESLTASRWFAYYGFPASAVCVKETASALDGRAIYFALERGRVLSGNARDRRFASGYGVNEYMMRYFEEAAAASEAEAVNREFELWNITFYKMMLHKRLMGERIAFLSKAGGPQELDRVADLYQRCGHILRQVKGYAYKYERTGDKGQLLKLSQAFNKLFEYEKRAVPMLMEALVYMRIDPYRAHNQKDGG